MTPCDATLRFLKVAPVYKLWTQPRYTRTLDPHAGSDTRRSLRGTQGPHTLSQRRDTCPLRGRLSRAKTSRACARGGVCTLVSRSRLELSTGLSAVPPAPTIVPGTAVLYGKAPPPHRLAKRPGGGRESGSPGVRCGAERFPFDDDGMMSDKVLPHTASTPDADLEPEQLVATPRPLLPKELVEVPVAELAELKAALNSSLQRLGMLEAQQIATGARHRVDLQNEALRIAAGAKHAEVQQAARRSAGGLVWRILRGFASKYGHHTPPPVVSIHTWAFTTAIDPRTSCLGALKRMCLSLCIVLLQISFLVAIVNESTMMKPCEQQGDCNSGTMCTWQNINQLVTVAPVAADGYVPFDFRRRCWDCVYSFLISKVTSMSNASSADTAATYDAAAASMYGAENWERIAQVAADVEEKCLAEDKFPGKCDALVDFSQKVTIANVIVLIITATLLALPLIADFEQALSDAFLLTKLMQAKLDVGTVGLGFMVYCVNTLRIGVLPAMTTIATSALLISTGASTQNILLNFAAISIVTEFDDHLAALFIHPSLLDELTSHMERATEEVMREEKVGGHPWLSVRLMLLPMTLILMPAVILNIESWTSFVYHHVTPAGYPWNRNPGFADAQWRAISRTEVVPCEAVYPALDFLGFLVGCCMVALFFFTVSAQYVKKGDAARGIVPLLLTYLYMVACMFLCQQIISKDLLGDQLLQFNRVSFDSESSKAAIRVVTWDWISEELNHLIPPDVFAFFVAQDAAST